MTPGRDEEVARAVGVAAAAESALIVSTVVRLTADWDLAEDCLQEAFARALAVWPTDGVPRNPGAWLTTVAKNRAIDQLRRAAAEKRAVRSAARERELEQEGGQVDERAAGARSFGVALHLLPSRRSPPMRALLSLCAPWSG